MSNLANLTVAEAEAQLAEAEREVELAEQDVTQTSFALRGLLRNGRDVMQRPEWQEQVDRANARHNAMHANLTAAIELRNEARETLRRSKLPAANDDRVAARMQARRDRMRDAARLSL